MSKMRAAKQALAMSCVALMASFAFTATAFAATVHGADYHSTGSALESGQINVLGVDGSAGETVFLTVKSGNTVLAKNRPYTIGKDSEAGESGEWAGVATLDVSALNPNALDGTYTIEAYADRADSDQLYSGAIYGVYADLPDGTSKLIGTRTVNADEASQRAFEPEETLFIDSKNYKLAADQAKTGAGALNFKYDEYDQTTTVDGVIKYTNAAGEVVASTKIPGLAYGEQRNVDIPTVVLADNGDVYRTVFFNDQVVASNPGRTSYSIYCTQMSEASKTLAGYYLATIQMVDESGNVIASDSVNVTGDFVYTAPETIYKTVSNNGESAVMTYRIDGSPTINLSAANDGVSSRERTITVSYKADPLDASEVEVTFNLYDGSKSKAKKEKRSLGTKKVVCTDENSPVMPDEQLEVNGVKYNLAGSPSDYAYTLHSGQMPAISVYYVPEGFVVPDAYDVTVNYVNFLTGEVVESHSYKSDPHENARIIISTPETFSNGGVDYVRLAGQEADIQHSYYSDIPTYTVYYRDKNDTLSSDVVINNIRVVYADGTTEGGEATTADGGVVTEGDGGTTAGGADADAGAAAGGAQALQLNDEGTYNVFDGAGNTTMTNESGVDSNTERIEDTETPLASGVGTGATSSAASSLTSTLSNWVLPVGIAAVVLVIAIVALVTIRRRKNDDMYEM